MGYETCVFYNLLWFPYSESPHPDQRRQVRFFTCRFFFVNNVSRWDTAAYTEHLIQACGGGLEIHSADDFQRIMQHFIKEPASMKEAGRQSGQFVEQMTGATGKILSDVKL